MSRFSRIEIGPRVVRLLKRGDRRAAEHVYRCLSPLVHGLARRILQDGQLAAEVTQDTFVDVLEKAVNLENDQALVGWVRSIAVNHCLMRLRSPWYQRRDAEVRAETEDPSNNNARLDGLADIERALAHLPAETRFVVWMHEVEGYTHMEIGGLCGRSTSYSKSQLARGYAQLSGLFEDMRDESGSEPEQPAPAWAGP